MKRILSLILALLLFAGLCGCHFSSSDIIEPVEFYYQRGTFEYGNADSVITSETREASGHVGDLNYLLSLYLRGPLDPNLRAPFPVSSKLMNLTLDGDTLSVTLDSTFASLAGIDLTVACACIAKTCFALADVSQVQIMAMTPDDTASIDVTINAHGLLLEDGSGLQPAATE